MDEQISKTEGDPTPAKYKDLPLPELFDMFPNDRAVTEWFESNIWPDGRKCPQYGYKYTCTFRHPSMPYYCAECDKRFSVRAGTIMEHSKIGYRNWAVATHILATRPKGISSVHLGRDLGDQAEFGAVPAAQAQGGVAHHSGAGADGRLRWGGRGVSGRAPKE